MGQPARGRAAVPGAARNVVKLDEYTSSAATRRPSGVASRRPASHSLFLPPALLLAGVPERESSPFPSRSSASMLQASSPLTTRPRPCAPPTAEQPLNLSLRTRRPSLLDL